MDPESTPAAQRERRRDWLKSQWESNHVNFLIGFVLAILGANMLFVAYQQNKFVPLKFPGTKAFRSPEKSNGAMQTPSDKSIGIRVTGGSSVSGTVVVLISESKQSFQDPQLAGPKWKIPIEGGRAILFADHDALPESFAITVFHDEDGSDSITLSSTGVPLERYGYTGDQRFQAAGVLPTFDQVEVERPEAGSTIDVFIR